MIDYEKDFSEVAKRAKRSEIRELLKLTQKPEIISFAGGLPDPQSFPIDVISEITDKVIEQDGEKALQYGPTEGHVTLCDELRKWMLKDDIDVSPDQILITNGSQQGLDLVGKVFLDPGDTLIVEMPSYIGGLQAFNNYLANMEGVPQDDDGMRMDLLEDKLKELEDKKINPKFIYVVPDFQNPSGVTLPEKRRVRLLELAEEFDTLIIEDSPYRELRYEGKQPTPIFTLDKNERVIAMSTFSKIFCPGFRLAWMYGPQPIIDKCVMAKQSMDLCTSPFNQAIAAEFMSRGLLYKQIEKIKDIYKEKRKLMLDSLEKEMPEGVTWTKPDGGLFLWVRLPDGMSATEMFEKAISNNVAYVIGAAFHHDRSGENTMRINFSYPTLEEIVEGAKRLGKTIKEAMK